MKRMPVVDHCGQDHITFASIELIKSTTVVTMVALV
jgi:hypothetical protein